MSVLPDNLTTKQYALLSRLVMGNVKYFNNDDAAVLIDYGFAIITELGELQITDDGERVPRPIKVSR